MNIANLLELCRSNNAWNIIGWLATDSYKLLFQNYVHRQRLNAQGIVRLEAEVWQQVESKNRMKAFYSGEKLNDKSEIILN